MGSLNLEISKKSTFKEELEYELKTTGNNGEFSLKNMLINLKDKYIDFASDNTRVSSTRIMASKFANEIEQILKLM